MDIEYWYSSLLWPDPISHRGIIACRAFTVQAIIPLREIEFGHMRLQYGDIWATYWKIDGVHQQFGRQGKPYQQYRLVVFSTVRSTVPLVARCICACCLYTRSPVSYPIMHTTSQGIAPLLTMVTESIIAFELQA